MKRVLCQGAAVIVLTLLVLSGCGGEPETAQAVPETAEDRLRAGVTQELERIKALSRGTMGALAEGAEASLEDYTVDPQALIQAAMAEFDYRIDQVVLNEAETAADVTLTFTTKPAGQALVHWMETRDRAKLSTLAALPKEELGRQLRVDLVKAIHAAPPVETAAVLPWAYIEGRWTLTPAGREALTAVFLGETA